MPGLDAAVSLARTTIKITFDIASAVVNRVVDEVQHKRDDAEPEPPAPSSGRPAAVPDVYDLTPPEPLVEEPTPVVPDELVAESADDGAQDGPGAAIRVDEPWDGYKEMTAAAINDRLVVADAATLTQIRLYESAHRKRKTVLAAVDKRLAES